jgi:hypothetical protein
MNWKRRAVGKVTSGELLIKQAVGGKIYKNAYILKLLLNLDTAGTKPLSYRGISVFICVCQRGLPPVSSAML